MNIHGGDLHEIDKNDRTRKTVAKTDQKSSEKRLLGLKKNSHTIQKVPGFLPKLGGWDKNLSGGDEGATPQKNG